MIVQPNISIQKHASALGKEQEMRDFLELFRNPPLEELLKKFLQVAKVKSATAKFSVLANEEPMLNSGENLFTFNYNTSKGLFIFINDKNKSRFNRKNIVIKEEALSYFNMMKKESFGNMAVSFEEDYSLASNYATMLCAAIVQIPKGSMQYVVKWDLGNVVYYNSKGMEMSKQEEILGSYIDESKLIKRYIGITPGMKSNFSFPYNRVKFGDKFKFWITYTLYNLNPILIFKKLFYRLFK